MAARNRNETHVYDAILDSHSDLQRFFEGDNLVVATRFFRNAELFQQLGTMVIPNLLNSGLRRRGSLHIWSAGCSDGRETYSLAMAARTILDDLGRQDVAVKVRGSDLSRPQIEIARRGTYRVSGADLPTLKPYRQYFEEPKKNIWQIASGIKNAVESTWRQIWSTPRNKRLSSFCCHCCSSRSSNSPPFSPLQIGCQPSLVPLGSHLFLVN